MSLLLMGHIPVSRIPAPLEISSGLLRTWEDLKGSVYLFVFETGCPIVAKIDLEELCVAQISLVLEAILLP